MGFAEERDRLRAAGFRPSRRLGQNFLIDPGLCERIATSLPLTRQSLVLEIGAGTGRLTRELCARAGSVVAVEIDERLCAFLRDAQESWPGGDARRLRLVAGSVLEDDELAPGLLRALSEEGAGREASTRRGYLCFANLPYAVSGPCLAALACAPRPPEALVFLCQSELGDRLLAGPGSKRYGSLSVLLGSCWEPRRLRRIGSEAFRPRPKVESSLVSMTPRADGHSLLTRPAGERRAFASFLRALFGARRKQLRNALARVEGAREAFAAAALPAAWLARRPETFDAAELWRVFAAWLACA